LVTDGGEWLEQGDGRVACLSSSVTVDRLAPAYELGCDLGNRFLSILSKSDLSTCAEVWIL